MITTKEQERKALEQIRKIVAGLGENSYIATAFEGCFEIAEENIENDFACSMKQRAESAEKKVSKLELDNRDLRLAVKKAKEEASHNETELRKQIDWLEARFLGKEDLEECEKLIEAAVEHAEKMVEAAAAAIVQNAEEPTSNAFQNAVQEHREMSKMLKRYQGLRTRVSAATKAGA